jgi:hypothetical protein
VNTEENINKIFDIMTELHAREVSGNCVVRELQGKGWNDLCDMAILLIAEIRPNFSFKVLEGIIKDTAAAPDMEEAQEVKDNIE